MKVYLYTENFETKSFDLFTFDENDLQKVPDKDAANLLSTIADYECQSDIDTNGVAIEGVKCHSVVRFSFKIKVDQVAPSGRGRLIWGMWEGKAFSESGVRMIGWAIQALLGRCELSIPQDRLSTLEKKMFMMLDRQHVAHRKHKAIVSIAFVTIVAIVLVLMLLLFN